MAVDVFQDRETLVGFIGCWGEDRRLVGRVRA